MYRLSRKGPGLGDRFYLDRQVADTSTLNPKQCDSWMGKSSNWRSRHLVEGRVKKASSWIASCCFFPSTLPQKPATVTEQSSNLANQDVSLEPVLPVEFPSQHETRPEVTVPRDLHWFGYRNCRSLTCLLPARHL